MWNERIHAQREEALRRLHRGEDNLEMAWAQYGVHLRAARRRNGGALIFPVILMLCEPARDLRPGTTGEIEIKS